MDNFLFVFIDGGENFLIDEHRFDGIGNVDLEYHPSNKTPISKIFNSVLDHERDSLKKHDFIVFMHGDVDTDVNLLMTRLSETSKQYDVVGLAGTKKMDVSESPLNWFTSSRKFPGSRFGHIVMMFDGNERECFYNKETPDVKDTRVACIDGLCIACGRNLIDSDFRFHEDIADFDFYDTDISLQCNLKYKFKLGVIVQKTMHTSVGMSILSENFLESEKKFREKFDIN